MIIYTASLLIVLIMIYFQEKLSSFLNLKYRKTNHDISSKKTHRIGGLYLFVFAALNIIFQNELYLINQKYKLLVFSSLIFFVGFLDDILQIHNKIKLILISIIVLIYVITSNSFIETFNISLFDFLNDYLIFKIIISTACILIAIISYNVIDGLDGLLLFEFIKFLMLLYFFTHTPEIIYILALIVILYYNNYLKNVFFLGDGGAYFLGFIASVFAINSQNTLIDVDPWILACLFSYPFCEQFITIFRRYFFLKISPFKEDNMHLHHLIFKRVFSLNKNLSLSNKLSSLIICLFNSIFGIVIILNYINGSFSFKLLFFLYLIFYILIYLFSYKNVELN